MSSDLRIPKRKNVYNVLVLDLGWWYQDLLLVAIGIMRGSIEYRKMIVVIGLRGLNVVRKNNDDDAGGEVIKQYDSRRRFNAGCYVL